MGLVGGVAHRMQDGSVEGSAKISDLTLHKSVTKTSPTPTSKYLTPAASTPTLGLPTRPAPKKYAQV